jgi:hypothetical protein
VVLASQPSQKAARLLEATQDQVALMQILERVAPVYITSPPLSLMITPLLEVVQ